MNKIRVVHHSKSVGYSGTDRVAQVFCKYLALSDKYEPFLLYRENDSANTRLDIVKKWLGEDHVIPYEWSPGKNGKIPPYMPEHDNFFDVMQKIDPQIVHYHAAGITEWPIFKWLSPKAKIVTTNIFGFNDETRQADLILYICDYNRKLGIKHGERNGPFLYNPIEVPYLDMTPENKAWCRQQLLDNYKLPRNAIILGRVGRADNFDPISLRAFAEVEKIHPEAHYLVVSPCPNWIETARKLQINNVHFIDPIIKDDELSNFYRGLDVFAHARSDGEICSTAIQQAMMHGIPVVSHESAIYNGQAETIDDTGFVVPIGNYEAYRDVLVQLIENPEMVNEDETGMVRLRDHFARQARRRGMMHFEASCITFQLQKLYDGLLDK